MAADQLRRTKVVDTHWRKSRAEREARYVQRAIDIALGVVKKNPGELAVRDGIENLLEANGIPGWSRSVHTKPAGWFRTNVIVSSLEYKDEIVFH